MSDRQAVKDYVRALRKSQEADAAYSAAVLAQADARGQLTEARKALSTLVGANIVERNFRVDEKTVLQVAFVGKDEPHVQLLTLED